MSSLLPTAPKKETVDLKKFLKTLKLNESSISMVLGALVIVIVGVLVVNYLKDNKGLLPGGSVSTNQTESETHTVVKGETLWSISEKHYGTGYKWIELAEANSLQNANAIEEGQTLVLVASEDHMMPSESPAPTSDSQAIVDATYTVAKGDHLWGIAVRTYGDGYKWMSIAQANNLKNPDLLFVGTVLTLPR